jgi:cell division protein FtsX
VPGVVARLQVLGYRTEDRLRDLEALAKLGRVLLGGVGIFVTGLALLAAITVGITCNQSIRSRLHEIGLLRAHGQSTPTIASIFLMQGALLGGAAFVAGAMALFAAGGWLRESLVQALGLPREFLDIESGDLALLALAAGTLAILGPMLAMLPAVIRACGLPPSELLRSR